MANVLRQIVNISSKCSSLASRSRTSSWIVFDSVMTRKFTSTTEITRNNISTRVDLAAAYRGLCMYDMHEGICNHLSALTTCAFADDGKKNGREILLLIPYGIHWSKVTAGCLVGMDLETGEILENGNTKYNLPERVAMNIHRGIYLDNRDKADIRSVFHVHSKYATTLACLEDPTILPVQQGSARFYNDTAYDNFYAGFADCLEEGTRLSRVLGDKRVLMMGNHGCLTVGSSVAVAFDKAYYLERACMFQVEAMKTGKTIKLIPVDVAAIVRQQGIEEEDMFAEAHLTAIKDKLKAEQPDFEIL